MHLYISNSNTSFFIKLVIAFFLFMVVYFSVVSFIPKDLHGASQWQGNILKAQEYAFSDNYYPTVIVGSSRLYRIQIPNAFNLAFTAGNDVTGLKIIENQPHKPKRVFVEMSDTVNGRIDDSIIRKTYWWNKYPWNRENTRIDYLIVRVKNIFLPKIKQLLHRNITNEKTDENSLKRAQSEYQKLLDQDKFQERAEQLKFILNNLQSEGCQIILVEPPHDVSLYMAPQMKQVRTVLQEVFPKNQYEWITVDWAEYVTTDGIHMSDKRVAKYSAHLVSCINDADTK